MPGTGVLQTALGTCVLFTGVGGKGYSCPALSGERVTDPAVL